MSKQKEKAVSVPSNPSYDPKKAIKTKPRALIEDEGDDEIIARFHDVQDETDPDEITSPIAPDGSVVYVPDTMRMPDYTDGENPIDRTIDAIAEAPQILHLTSPENAERYTIRPFRWEYVAEDFTIVNWGKRRSGKTRFTRAFMKATRARYVNVIIFTGSYYDHEYDDLVPVGNIVDGLKMDVLKKMIITQEEAVEKIQSTHRNEKNISLLIVFDDVLGDNALRHAPYMEDLFFRGRHLKCTIIINLQDTKGIPPNMKSNTDLAVSYVQRSQRDKEAMREQFADFLKNDNDWEALIQPLLELYSYTFAAFITSTPRLKQKASITIGIAQEPEQGENQPPIVMGNRKMWKDYENQLMSLKNGWMLLMSRMDNNWGVITKYTPGFVGSKDIWTPELEPMPDWYRDRAQFYTGTQSDRSQTTMAQREYVQNYLAGNH